MNQPFKLEAFKAGDVALSSGGSEFRFVGTVPDGTGDIVVLGASGGLTRISPDGSSWHNTNRRVDLVSMKPKTKVVWINLYQHVGSVYQAFHDSESVALQLKGSNALNERPIRAEVRV